LFEDLPGMSKASKMLFIKRFEFTYFRFHKDNFLTLRLDDRKVINMYLSRITSINNRINEFIRYSLIRIYLIRTHRGKAQALGKPSRGQRTWSNA